MSQKDYIGTPKKIEQHITFDQKEFRKALDSWFNNLGYRYLETGHKEKQLASGINKLSFTWGGEKKVSTYMKLAIELDYSSATKNIVVEKDDKKVTLQEGEVGIEIAGFLKKDIRDEWGIRQETGTMKFLREAYDKIFGKDKISGYESQLKKDIEKILNDIKTYLKLSRLD